MWYAIAIAVATLGMYFILAHKDRELSGRTPHRMVRALRDEIDRFVARVSRKIGHTTHHAVLTSAQVTKKLCVGGGKICVKCCSVAYEKGTMGVKAVAQSVRKASRKLAHPSTREDSATLAQR